MITFTCAPEFLPYSAEYALRSIRTSAIASRLTMLRLFPLYVSILRPPSSVQLFELVWPPLKEKGTLVFEPNPGCCAWLEFTPGCSVISCVKLLVFSASSCTCVPKIVLPTFAVAVSTCATLASTSTDSDNSADFERAIYAKGLTRAEAYVRPNQPLESTLVELDAVNSGGYLRG